MSEEIRFKKLHKDAQLPKYLGNSSAFALRSPENIYLRYGTIQTLSIGVELTISEGYELHIIPFPELAPKGVTIINSPAVLTRGEVTVYLTSLGLEPVYISRGDVVAHAMVQHVTRLPINPRPSEEKE